MLNGNTTSKHESTNAYQKYFQKIKGILRPTFKGAQMSLKDWEKLESKKRPSPAAEPKYVGFKRVQ